MPRASLFIIIRRLFCSLLLASLAFAQDAATGAIRGIVLDPTGSRIAQASIVAVNSATGARYSTTSDAEGRFSLELLPPGDYTARAVADGMSPQVTPQLHVDVGAAAELEFHLTIAGLQENVTVSSAPRLVDTNPSAVNTLIDERAIADLPLTGRRFSDLMLLSPGVTQDPRNLTSATNGDLSFGGLRGFQNSFLVDGGDFNNAFFAQARGLYRAPYQFSNEVVQEFRVSSNSYGAENASTLPATGDQTTYSSPASPVTYDSISDNGEETVSTDTGSVSLTSGLTTRLISHLRAQFSRDLRQSYTNTNDTPIKIPDIIDGTGRSDQLPRATREHRAQLAETLRLDTSRHSFKFGGDSLVTWIYDFFPSQQSGECLFDVIKVDPFTFEPMEAGLPLTPLRAYAHAVPHYYLQNFGPAASNPNSNDYAAFAQDTIRVTDHLARPQPRRSLGPPNLHRRRTAIQPAVSALRQGSFQSPQLRPPRRTRLLHRQNSSPRHPRWLRIVLCPHPADLQLRHRHRKRHQTLNFFSTIPTTTITRSFPPIPTRSSPVHSLPLPAISLLDLPRASPTMFPLSPPTSSPRACSKPASRSSAKSPTTPPSPSPISTSTANTSSALDVNLPPPVALTYPIFDSTGSIFQNGFYTVDSFATWQYTQSLTCPFPPCINPLGRPIAQLGKIDEFQSAASSLYNGATVSINRRMARGTYLRLAYTYAHAIDDGQDALVAGEPATLQNSYQPNAERGPSVTDQRNRFVAAFSAEPRPFHRGHELLGHIFNDWKIPSIVTAGRGRPVNATVSGDPNQDGNYENDRLPGTAATPSPDPTTPLPTSASFAKSTSAMATASSSPPTPLTSSTTTTNASPSHPTASPPKPPP